MNYVELKAELEKVKERKFYNNMVDRWSDENCKIDRECTEKINSLQKKIEETESLQEFAQWLWDNHYLRNEAFTVNLTEQFAIAKENKK